MKKSANRSWLGYASFAVTAIVAVVVAVGAIASCQPDAESSAANDGGAPNDAAPSGPFHSLLYPPDWTPGFQDSAGHFLNDFSYAGYKNGELPIPNTPPGAMFDAVATYGADPTAASDSTAAIQAALDAAGNAGGGVVFLPKGLYRCDGLLTVTKSKVVLRGAGAADTRIYFTRTTGLTDNAHLTFRGTLRSGPDLPLVEEGQELSREVRIADASSIKVGDDITIGWVITSEFIAEHNMTGIWMAFNGTWQPFFRRRVLSVDTTATPHRVRIDVPLRYVAKLRDSASLRIETGHLIESGIESLAVANAVAWDAAWTQLRAHAIAMIGVKDGWIRKVQSFASPASTPAGYHLQNGGLVIKDSKRFTVSETRMEKAQNRGDGGCGYLFEVSTSNEVLIVDSSAADGRHNFIQNWDFGATGLVFLRIDSTGSRVLLASVDPIGFPAASEYHHSLTMACLVDQSSIHDAWHADNRGTESTGAGITATQDVFWNNRGGGGIDSFQFGYGYVIGTKGLTVNTDPGFSTGVGTAPEDYVEGLDRADDLQPPSLYDDQLSKRLSRGERLW